MLVEIKINDQKLLNKLDWVNKLRIQMIKIMEEINKINVTEMDNEIFEKINLFMDFMKYKNFSYHDRTMYVYHFIKKIIKKNIKMEILIKLPIKKVEIQETPLKFLNKLFSK